MTPQISSHKVLCTVSFLQQEGHNVHLCLLLSIAKPQSVDNTFSHCYGEKGGGEFLLKFSIWLPRFCKPLDMRLLRQMAKEHPIMITVEENGIGGFGSHGRPRFAP